MTGVLKRSWTHPHVFELVIPVREMPTISLMAMKKIGSVKATETQNLVSIFL